MVTSAPEVICLGRGLNKGRTGRRLVLYPVGRDVPGEVVSEPVLLDSAKMGGNPVLHHLRLVIIIAHGPKVLNGIELVFHGE